MGRPSNRPKRPARSTARKIRSQRRQAFRETLQKFEEYGKIPSKLRQRLEREPIVRRRVRGKKVPLNLRELSLMGLSKRFQKKHTVWSGIVPLIDVVMRDTFERLGLSKKARLEINRLLKSDSYFFEKLRYLVTNSPTRERDTRRYFKMGLKSIAHAFRMAGERDRSEAERKAKTFFEAFRDNMLHYQTRPVFYKTGRGKTSLTPEPGFASFLRQIGKQKDITAFIENQQNVERTMQLPMGEDTTILELPHARYDISKVKEFSLSNGRGKRIRVVSKRLSPIKSITAEKEFKASQILHANGIRIPRPVGVVKDKGNTYFLWEKLKDVKDSAILDQHYDSISLQKQLIARRLNKLGVKHRDMANRNFIVTLERGQPLVWLIDLERVEIPRQLARRK